MDSNHFRDWIETSARRVSSLKGVKVDWRLTLIDSVVERARVTSAGARYVARTICYIKYSGLFKEPSKYTAYENWSSVITNASKSVFVLLLKQQLDALGIAVDRVLVDNLADNINLRLKIESVCASRGLEVADASVLLSFSNSLQPKKQIASDVQAIIDDVGSIVAEQTRIRKEQERAQEVASDLNNNRDVMSFIEERLNGAALSMFAMGTGKKGISPDRLRNDAIFDFAAWQTQWLDAKATALKIDPVDVYKHLLRLRRRHTERYYIVRSRNQSAVATLAELLFLNCVYLMSSADRAAKSIRLKEDQFLVWPESGLSVYPAHVPTESALLSVMPLYEYGMEAYPATDNRSIASIVRRIAAVPFVDSVPYVYVWTWLAEDAIYFCCSEASTCQKLAALERLYGSEAYKRTRTDADKLPGYSRLRLNVYKRIDLKQTTVEAFLNAWKRERVDYLKFGSLADDGRIALKLASEAEEPLVGTKANLFNFI